MRRVLLLHTGGTLGMRGEPLEPDAYSDVITEAVPEILELAQLETRIVFNLDSSDIGPEHWAKLAEIIRDNHNQFDGFVIIHGTDTMAYTASALSFALEGLDRPVILTGAQRPLSATRTDARRNLADAVELATRPLFEVGICFDGLLLRGVRTIKSHTQDYRAFTSPGCEPLARLGVDVVLGDHLRYPRLAFEARPIFDERVLALRVTPGMSPKLLESVLSDREHVQGLVLAAFGLGTVPTQTSKIAEVIGRAIEEGLEVVVVTQSSGEVNLGAYANSRPLQEAGAIAGGAMTIEAAVAKLMHALARFGDDRGALREFMLRDVAGERS